VTRIPSSWGDTLTFVAIVLTYLAGLAVFVLTMDWLLTAIEKINRLP
jgi:preprotein translocase subunit SecE